MLARVPLSTASRARGSRAIERDARVTTNVSRVLVAPRAIGRGGEASKRRKDVRLTSTSSANEFAWYREPARVAIAGAWVVLGGIATFVAPSGTGAFDAELVKTIVGAPFSGAANPLFESLFNMLGVVPATYACLLLPGGKDQRLPASLCVGASFALGFFALGPYLATREPRVEAPRRSELGFVTRNVWESKVNAVLLFGFATFLAYYGASNLSSENVASFVTLLREQSMLACVSCCDLFVLSLCMVDAIAEDMRRRNVDPASAIAFAAVPVIGPTVWLLTRPALED